MGAVLADVLGAEGEGFGGELVFFVFVGGKRDEVDAASGHAS